MVKNPPSKGGDVRDADLIPRTGRFPGSQNATHCSILAWKIPWTEEPDRPQLMGSLSQISLTLSITFLFTHNIASTESLDDLLKKDFRAPPLEII